MDGVSMQSRNLCWYGEEMKSQFPLLLAQAPFLTLFCRTYRILYCLPVIF